MTAATFVSVPTADGMAWFAPEWVGAFESRSNDVLIHLKSGRAIVTTLPLDEVEALMSRYAEAEFT